MFQNLVLPVSSVFSLCSYKIKSHFFSKLFLSELVRRYLCVSPLLIAASMEGGWYELACIRRVVYW